MNSDVLATVLCGCSERSIRTVKTNERDLSLSLDLPKSAIEPKSLVKSASKIGRAGEGFLYDTL